MPESRTRPKPKRRYQQPPRRKPKNSPRWFGALILALWFVGVIVVVLNYLGLIPGTKHTATNLYLFVGLGLIAAGFLAATQWR